MRAVSIQCNFVQRERCDQEGGNGDARDKRGRNGRSASPFAMSVLRTAQHSIAYQEIAYQEVAYQEIATVRLRFPAKPRLRGTATEPRHAAQCARRPLMQEVFAIRR